MKARIPVSNTQRRRIEEEARVVCARELDRQRDGLTRRLFKLMIFALNSEYSFGRERCARVLATMTQLVEQSDTDEIFWEHIDRLVIDRLGLEFERDYTSELMKGR